MVSERDKRNKKEKETKKIDRKRNRQKERKDIEVFFLHRRRTRTDFEAETVFLQLEIFRVDRKSLRLKKFRNENRKVSGLSRGRILALPGWAGACILKLCKSQMCKLACFNINLVLSHFMTRLVCWNPPGSFSKSKLYNHFLCWIYIQLIL